MTSTKEASTRLGRRALVRGAVWSVPVIALTAPAPAFAASACASTTLSWDTFSSGTTISGNVGTYGGVSVTLALSGASGAPGNAQVTSTLTGNLSKVLRFYDLSTDNTSQTITFTFGKLVSRVAFSLLDVDRSTWDDRVVVNTSGFGFSLGSSVQGNGTSGSPFRATNTANGGVLGSSPNGNVDLVWTGARTSVSFTYAQGNVSSNQAAPFIGISDIQITPSAC